MPYFDFGFDVFDEKLERVIIPDFEVIVDASDEMGSWTVNAVFIGDLDKFGRLSKDAVELSDGDALSRRLWADAQAAAQQSIDDHGYLWSAINRFLEGYARIGDREAEAEAREDAKMERWAEGRF